MPRKFVGFRVDADVYDRFKSLVESQDRRVAEEVERFMRTCVDASSLGVLVGSAIGEKLWFESRVESEMKWLQRYLEAGYVADPYDERDPAEKLEDLLHDIRDQVTAKRALELLRKYDDLLLERKMREIEEETGEDSKV